MGRLFLINNFSNTAQLKDSIKLSKYISTRDRTLCLISIHSVN